MNYGKILEKIKNFKKNYNSLAKYDMKHIINID